MSECQKKLVRHRISSSSKLLQSDIDIPALRLSPVALVMDKSRAAQLWMLLHLGCIGLGPFIMLMFFTGTLCNCIGYCSVPIGLSFYRERAS